MRSDMTGKTVLITGASAGLGKATAAELAARGAQLELASLRSVRACAGKLEAEYPRINVLINNAGLFPPMLQKTEDGFEMQIGVNHLGHFLLTNLLFDRLVASAPARVVHVSSMMYAGGKLDFASFRGPAKYSAYAAYRQSKLANILSSNELARRLAGRGVTSNSLHPGGVATEIMRDAALAMRARSPGSRSRRPRRARARRCISRARARSRA